MTMRSHWRLNPEIDFLNHGSFGATPSVVLEYQSRLRDQLESDPIRFLAPERELEPKLDHVRGTISTLIGTDAANLAFVRNATDGVNAVLRSFPLRRGDEVVITNHGYNACNNAVRFATARVEAATKVARIPFPIEDAGSVVSAIEATLSERTRLILVDHVTSPTGLVFPVEQIVEMAHRRGIRVMIDGAHAPGMLPLNLRELDADYYTANHHKWLCAPKASGFLVVRPEFQNEVHPTIISHAYNRPRRGRSQFLAEFDWMGTHDPTPLLSLPRAIEFLTGLHETGLHETGLHEAGLHEAGLDALMRENRERALRSQAVLCEAMEIAPPCPAAMIGSMVSVPLHGVDRASAESLARDLYEQHRVEVPIFQGVTDEAGSSEAGSSEAGSGDAVPLLRVSLQAYNHIGQIERLADILRRL